MSKQHSKLAFVAGPSGLCNPTSRNQDIARSIKNHLPMMMDSGGIDHELLGLTRDILTAAAVGATGDAIAQYSEYVKKMKAENSEFVDFTPWADGDEGIINKKSDFELDLRRTAAYATFGGGYTGGFQHFVFGSLHEQITDPLVQLTLNQGLIIPLAYYPLFYWLVPKLRARTDEEKKELRDKINIGKMIPRNWAFWFPLQFIQFQFVPMQLQVTYCAVVGLIWNILLSTFTAGATQQEPVPVAVSSPVDFSAIDEGMETSLGAGEDPVKIPEPSFVPGVSNSTFADSPELIKETR